jgi:hypothetical protein
MRSASLGIGTGTSERGTLAVQDSYRAETVDVIRANHVRLAFARENLGPAASQLNEAAEQRCGRKHDVAVFSDTLAPDVGSAARERPLDRMNVERDRAAGDVGQPVSGVGVHVRHRVRVCQTVPIFRLLPASQAAGIRLDATLHRALFPFLLPVKGCSRLSRHALAYAVAQVAPLAAIAAAKGAHADAVASDGRSCPYGLRRSRAARR